MRFVEGQLIGFAARVLYQHVRIVSEFYKTRNVQRGVEEKDFAKYISLGLLTQEEVDATRITPFGGKATVYRRLSDQEKLADEIGIMERHIQYMQECIEVLGDKEV